MGDLIIDIRKNCSYGKWATYWATGHVKVVKDSQ